MFKVVKNIDGKIVAFGPNDDNYEPFLKDGEVLIVEEKQPKMSQDDAIERAAARQAVLDKLGLTADEAAALLG